MPNITHHPLCPYEQTISKQFIHFVFRAYFLALLAAMRNSLSFKTVMWKSEQFCSKSDEKLALYELHWASVSDVAPLVCHSGEDPLNISSEYWNSQYVCHDREHVGKISCFKHDHPCSTTPLAFNSSYFFPEPPNDGITTSACII